MISHYAGTTVFDVRKTQLMGIHSVTVASLQLGSQLLLVMQSERSATLKKMRDSVAAGTSLSEASIMQVE